MKLTATLRIKDDINVKFLMRAFLTDFNPENGILIKGETVKLEIDPSNLQSDNIEVLSDAIGHCKVEELRCGKFTEASSTTEVDEAKEEQIVKDSETERQEELSCETSEDSSDEKTTDSNETTVIDKTFLSKRFDEFFEDSNTYTEFLEKVFEWFELNRENRLLIVNVIRYAKDIDKLTWVNAEKRLSENGVKLAYNYKTKLKKEIEKRTNMRAIGVIKLLIRYGMQASNTTQSSENNSVVDETEVKDTTVRKDVAELFSGTNFERRLQRMVKGTPISERLIEMLVYMGWENLNPKNQYIVLNICEIAMNLKEITFDFILADDRMESFRRGAESTINTFSSFLAKFMKPYIGEENVDPIAFLEYLQANILTDEEKAKL